MADDKRFTMLRSGGWGGECECRECEGVRVWSVSARVREGVGEWESECECECECSVECDSNDLQRG